MKTFLVKVRYTDRHGYIDERIYEHDDFENISDLLKYLNENVFIESHSEKVELLNIWEGILVK